MPLSDFLTSYRGREAQMQAQPLQELQQVGALQGILAKMTAAQEQQELKGMLSKASAASGGDPAKMVTALMNSGNPKAIELATHLKGLMPKPAEPYTLSPDQTRFDANGKPIAFGLPKPDKEFAPPEILRLQESLAKYPEGHPLRKQIEARIKILGERSPGVTVNMPASSDTVQGPDGKFYKLRIGKDGKVETIPMQTPTGDPLRPPETPAAAKATEERTAEAQTVESVRARIGKMASLIQGGSIAGGVVGPLGMASRIGETAVGAVQPSAATPALDYQNEMRLLLSDVRKMVEKDPNLSKDEREAMYETLGGGIMQTPGSAIRTLNNIVAHVESKQRSGAGRSTRNELARQVQAAGWAYEPNKYDYRVTDGKVQRKAK